MTTLQFDERWNIVYDSLRHFEMKWILKYFPLSMLLSQAISIYIPSCTVINPIHSLMVMWLPVVEIHIDDAYVLIDAIKIISLRIKKNVTIAAVVNEIYTGSYTTSYTLPEGFRASCSNPWLIYYILYVSIFHMCIQLCYINVCCYVSRWVIIIFSCIFILYVVHSLSLFYS